MRNRILIFLIAGICLHAGKCGRDSFEIFEDIMLDVIEDYEDAAGALDKADDASAAARILKNHTSKMKNSAIDLKALMDRAPELKPENRLKAPVKVISLTASATKARKKFLLALALNSPRFILSADYRALAGEAREQFSDLFAAVAE
jgi:hypothetical protein